MHSDSCSCDNTMQSLRSQVPYLNSFLYCLSATMEQWDTTPPIRFQLQTVHEMMLTIIHTTIVVSYYYMYAQLWIIERACFYLDQYQDSAIQRCAHLFPHVPPWQLPPLYLRIPSKLCRIIWSFTIYSMVQLVQWHDIYKHYGMIELPSFGMNLAAVSQDMSGPHSDCNIGA